MPPLLSGWLLKLKQPKARLVDRIGGAWARRWFELREVDSPTGTGQEWALCQTRQQKLRLSRKGIPESFIYLRHVDAVRPSSGHPSFTVGDRHSEHLQHPQHVERNRAEMREYAELSIEIIANHCNLFLRFDTPTMRMRWATALPHLAGLRLRDMGIDERDVDAVWGRGGRELPRVPSRMRRLREETLAPVAPSADGEFDAAIRPTVARAVRDSESSRPERRRSERERERGRRTRSHNEQRRGDRGRRDDGEEASTERSLRSGRRRRDERRSRGDDERLRRARDRDAPLLTDDRGDRSPQRSPRTALEASGSRRTSERAAEGATRSKRSTTRSDRTPDRARRRPIDFDSSAAEERASPSTAAASSSSATRRSTPRAERTPERSRRRPIDEAAPRAETEPSPLVLKGASRATAASVPWSDDEELHEIVADDDSKTGGDAEEESKVTSPPQVRRALASDSGAARTARDRHGEDDSSSDVVSLDDADFMAQMSGESDARCRSSSPAPAHIRSISDQEGMHQDARRRSGATSTPRGSTTAESSAKAAAVGENNVSESSDWDADDGSGAVAQSPATQSPATRRSHVRSTSPSTPTVTDHAEWDSSEGESEGGGGARGSGEREGGALGTSASTFPGAGPADGMQHDEWDDSSDASPAAHRGK